MSPPPPASLAVWVCVASELASAAFEVPASGCGFVSPRSCDAVEQAMIPVVEMVTTERKNAIMSSSFLFARRVSGACDHDLATAGDCSQGIDERVESTTCPYILRSSAPMAAATP